MDDDFEVRNEALAHAINIMVYGYNDSKADEDDAIRIAAKFEKYLRDGTVPTLTTAVKDGKIITLARKESE